MGSYVKPMEGQKLLSFLFGGVGPGKLFPMIHPLYYSILLFPKFLPIILSNQSIILNYSQSVTNNGENIILLAVTKKGTCIYLSL